MEPIQFLPKQVNEFVKKMQAIVILEGCDPPIPYLLKLEGMKEVVDADYVKYLARKHIVNILKYIDGKGVVLEDISSILIGDSGTAQLSHLPQFFLLKSRLGPLFKFS